MFHQKQSILLVITQPHTPRCIITRDYSAVCCRPPASHPTAPQRYVSDWNESVDKFNASHRMTGAKTVKNLHLLPFVTELLQHVANLNDLVKESLMINAGRGRVSGGPGTGPRGCVAMGWGYSHSLVVVGMESLFSGFVSMGFDCRILLTMVGAA